MNEKRAKLKIREIIKILEKDGWYLVATRGSHRQFKHDIKQGRVTVPGHIGDDVPIPILHSILKQANLEKGKK